MNQKWYQQGDVIVVPAEIIPEDAKKGDIDPNRHGFVLAHGESGHAHVVEEIGGVEFFEKDGMFYLKNENPVIIRHEEHKPVTLPPGVWRTYKVREYDHFAEEARAVQD